MFTLTVHWADRVYTIPAEAGANLHELLSKHEIALYAPCNGRGICQKCYVTYRTGDITKLVLACQTSVSEDAEVWVPEITGSGLTNFDNDVWSAAEAQIGAAVDIGTTTVAAALVDCSNGQTIDRRAALNPQHVCGSDVISRISACSEGKLELMTSLIRKTVSSLLTELCTKHHLDQPETVTVSGNTTMLHLFCGVDPAPIGVVPFTPVFTQMKTFAGSELAIPAKTVYVLPSASGYIGSDVVCGIIATKLKTGGVSLLADLGTNGEFALFDGNKLYCASAAVGPALEGANISCGIGGIPGAICVVAYNDGCLTFETIDSNPPVGICGSGLVDLIAVLLDAGIIEESGRFQEDSQHPLAVQRLRDDRFMLTDHIWLSQNDIRQFQLAKAAVTAGILTLCSYAGVIPQDIENVYLTGGLGYYIPQKSALRTGLIPPDFSGKLRSVGNSSLAGAIQCLLPEKRLKASHISESITVCELNERADFSQCFIDNITFANL